MQSETLEQAPEEMREEEVPAEASEELALDRELEAALEEEQPLDPDAGLDAQLDRLLYAIGKRKQEMQRNQEIHAERLRPLKEKLDTWLAGENMMLERQVEHLERRVRDLAQGYDYGKKKSRALAFGTFGVRQKAESVEITDAARAIDFSRTYGLPVRVKVEEAVDKKALLAFIKRAAEEGTEVESMMEEGGFRIAGGYDEFFLKV